MWWVFARFPPIQRREFAFWDMICFWVSELNTAARVAVRWFGYAKAVE